MMSELCHCFGIAVRQIREMKSWSQEMLAETADLNRSYVGEIERGKVIPSLVTIDKLSVALGLSLPELFAHCENLRRLKARPVFDLTSIAC